MGRYVVILSAIVCAIAFLAYQKGDFSHVHKYVSMFSRKPKVWESLENTTASVKPRLNRVAIGYNANLDLIVHDSVEYIHKFSYAKAVRPLDHETVGNRAHFCEAYAHFFERGAAGERYVSDAALWKQIVEAAQSSAKKEYSVGGNAALMAQALGHSGVAVMLGGSVGPQLAKLLPSSIRLTGEHAREDEIHLILEFEKDSEWRELVSPRANRFIVSHDQTNGVLKGLETFHKGVESFNPHAVVLAGMHLLEGRSQDYRTLRLTDVIIAARKVPLMIPIHFELASVGNADFMKLLGSLLLPEVDSLGLNEQELLSLYSALGGSAFTQWPTPENVARALDVVFNRTESSHGRGVKRIHFHFLHYHIIALRNFGNTEWSVSDETSRAGVAAGSVMTTRTACNFSSAPAFTQVDLPLSSIAFSSDYVTLHVEANGASRTRRGETLAVDGVVSWASLQQTRFHLAPVFVCHKPLRTVGLGDVISATGMRWIL